MHFSGILVIAFGLLSASSMVFADIDPVCEASCYTEAAECFSCKTFLNPLTAAQPGQNRPFCAAVVRRCLAACPQIQMCPATRVVCGSTCCAVGQVCLNGVCGLNNPPRNRQQCQTECQADLSDCLACKS
jgi:hypothetical protein